MIKDSDLTEKQNMIDIAYFIGYYYINLKCLPDI